MTVHYLEEIKGLCIYAVLNDCGVGTTRCKIFGAKYLDFSLVMCLVYSMAVNQVKNTHKKHADWCDLYCSRNWRKKPTLIKVKKCKWNTDTYRWTKCSPKSVSFFAIHHCGIHHDTCWWPLSVALLPFLWWLPQQKREERGVMPAMGGLRQCWTNIKDFCWRGENMGQIAHQLPHFHWYLQQASGHSHHTVIAKDQ